MGSEAALWTTLHGRIGDCGHVQRFEDVASTGIPDLNWGWRGRESWIELKHRAAWPKRPGTPVRIGLRQDQADWLRARWTACSDAWALVQVGREYLLFAGNEAQLLVDGMPREKFRRWARWIDGSLPDANGLWALMDAYY